MAFQISPGIVSKEIDLTTTLNPSFSTTTGGIVGPFVWGPLNDAVLVDGEVAMVETFWKPNSETYVTFFTAGSFLSYGNQLRVARVANELVALNSTSSTQSITGVVNVASGTLDLLQHDGVGTATLFDVELRAGQTIVVNAETRVVNNVVNSTQAYVTTDFSGAIANGNAVSVWGELIKNDADYDANFADGSGTSEVLWTAKYPGSIGDSMKVSICPSSNAFSHVPTETANTLGTTITFSANMAGQVVVGSYIKDDQGGSPSGEQRQITASTNNTVYTLASSFTTNIADATSVTVKWEYADVLGSAPGTTDYASTRGGLNDEMHMVIVDEDGDWTNDPGSILETYKGLSFASDAKLDDGSANYYAEKIARESKYIVWTDHLPAGLNWGTAAVGTTFTHVESPSTLSLFGGLDGNTPAEGFGNDEMIRGYDLFKNAAEVNVALLMGGDANQTVALHIIQNIAEFRKDVLAFFSPEFSDVVANEGNEVDDVVAFRNSLVSTSYASMDCNWKSMYDKYNDTFRWIPCNGDVAGLCVRTDNTRDAWFSPAGFNRGFINNAVKLAWNPNKAERDVLYPATINPINSFTGQGIILYGDKTMLTKTSAFQQIGVRRLFIILEKTIEQGAQYTLFEFNDAFTRNQFKSIVEPFLRDVKGRRGLFDFLVVCDESNNTPTVIDRNEFIGDIYLKPARSINFITLNFVAARTGVEFSEIVGKF